MLELKLDPCIPPPWAKGGHLQTMLGHLLPSPPLREKARRIEIELADGDRLVTGHLTGASGVVVYLFHGLSGSIEADYIRRTATIARGFGHAVFMANHRGCGEGAGLARHPYHSGRAEDLSAVIELGRKMHPGQRHLAIGFSLSGNALLLLMSGKRGTVRPDFAISVNAPINLERASIALTEGLNRVYDLRFVHECKRDIAIRGRMAPGQPQKYRIPWASTLREFDSIYTAPAGGFSSREDYYRSCSAAPVLEQIREPTLMITAKDDPFVSPIDYLDARLSPSVSLHLEEFGGHMGYLARARTPLGTRRWLDYALHEAMRALLKTAY